MKLGRFAGGVCRICGSDTMGADIGCSCMIMYNRAKKIALHNHEKESLEYNYSIEMRFLMDKFVAEYETKLEKHDRDLDKTFRNDFKKQFYPSVVSFYKSKGYVSKKQLDVVIRELYGFNGGCMSEDYKIIEDKKKVFLDNFTHDNDSEIVEITRNLWKQKKQK